MTPLQKLSDLQLGDQVRSRIHLPFLLFNYLEILQVKKKVVLDRPKTLRLFYSFCTRKNVRLPIFFGRRLFRKHRVAIVGEPKVGFFGTNMKAMAGNQFRNILSTMFKTATGLLFLGVSS